ncbi:11097_t:CDS:2 [Gigaspora margarita]|uniref:11097_t:CDS:1 n=1 Tax=Gigaspora margarita TaxID=4874 RepID=A0ABM8W163_GIGMA|nr:11097_t:CDS:2 [Gigaspora margarita]
MCILTKGPIDIEQDHLQIGMIDVNGLFDIRALKRKLENKSQPPSKRIKIQEPIIAKLLSRKIILEETINYMNNRRKINAWKFEPINEGELVEHKGCVVH